MNSGTTKSNLSDPLWATESSGFAAGEFSNCLLARNEPTLFSTLATEYSRIVQLAVEESLFRTDRHVFAKTRNLARSAGEKDAVPQDLIFVHISGLAMLAERVPRPLAKAYVQHARLLLLKMVGELALYYREQASLATGKDAAQ
jgi:hypothetical protein